MEVVVLSMENDSCGCENNEGRSKQGQNITIPEPVMTQDNKYQCPIDKAIYNDRKSYELHCAEEHDVL